MASTSGGAMSRNSLNPINDIKLLCTFELLERYGITGYEIKERNGMTLVSFDIFKFGEVTLESNHKDRSKFKNALSAFLLNNTIPWKEFIDRWNLKFVSSSFELNDCSIKLEKTTYNCSS